jgi:hypothetical protein
MHPAFIFLALWAFAFISLCLALLLLNIYSNVINYDFVLHGLRKEAVLAGVCSLIEGGSVWIIVTYLPAATRALILPALLIFVIYLLAHLEDWNRFDPGLVLIFQFVIGATAMALFRGYFGAAAIIVVVFLGVLAAVAGIARSL